MISLNESRSQAGDLIASTIIREQESEPQATVEIEIEQVMSRTKIELRTVLRFYFQWLNLILVHGLCFFYLPIQGNKLNLSRSYCSEADIKEGICKDFIRNPFIWIFYVICCFYFFLSAL